MDDVCLRDKDKNGNSVQEIRPLTIEIEDHTHEATLTMIKQNFDHLFTVPYSIWKRWVLAF